MTTGASGTDKEKEHDKDKDTELKKSVSLSRSQSRVLSGTRNRIRYQGRSMRHSALPAWMQIHRNLPFTALISPVFCSSSRSYPPFPQGFPPTLWENGVKNTPRRTGGCGNDSFGLSPKRTSLIDYPKRLGEIAAPDGSQSGAAAHAQGCAAQLQIFADHGVNQGDDDTQSGAANGLSLIHI